MTDKTCDMSHDRHNMSHDTWWDDIIVITSEMACDKSTGECNCKINNLTMWDLINLPTFLTCDMKLHCICQNRHVTWQDITCHMKREDIIIYVMSHVMYYVTSEAMHVKDLAMHASYCSNNVTN